MASTPVVSIVIAARSEGDNVRKTVDSITAHTQSHQYEIVLVDDANTDGSFDFLETPPYQHRHDIIYYRFETPVGCILGRHQGVRLSRGRYVLFLDAHMAVTDGWLDRFVRAAEKGGPRAAVTVDVANLDADTWALHPSYNSYLKIDKKFQFEWDPQLHHGHLLPTAGGACVLMARDLYWRVGGFDLGLRRWGCEFVDLILKVYAVGGVCLFEPDVTVGHLFRKTFPYEMSWRDLIYNTLRVGYVHLDDEAFSRFSSGVAEMPGFEEAWELFQKDISEIKARRTIQRRRMTRAPDWFVRTFLPELAGARGAGRVDLESNPHAESGGEGHPETVAPSVFKIDGVYPNRGTPGTSPAFSYRRGLDEGAAERTAWPRVSILIPVRNEGPHLERTIASIRAHTRYPDYEIVVVDDASSDGCCDFLDREASAPWPVRRVRYDIQKGYVTALNDAARLASGEVLKFLDAHQWVSPNWLTNLVAALEARDYQALVGPVVKPLHARTWRPAGNSSYGFATDRNFSDFWHLGPESVGPDQTVPFLVRHQLTVARRIFFELGGLSGWFRGHGFDDFDLCFRARARGLPIVVEPTVMVAHLPKDTFINDVTWEDIVFNKLVLAQRHFGDTAVDRLKQALEQSPGFAEGLRAFERIRHQLDRYPLGPPASQGVRDRREQANGRGATADWDVEQTLIDSVAG